jgi:hypothetical protein
MKPTSKLVWKLNLLPILNPAFINVNIPNSSFNYTPEFSTT